LKIARPLSFERVAFCTVAPRWQEINYPATDWDTQSAVSDEPWEVTYTDADTFEATF
jgi:hypothetical protein